MVSKISEGIEVSVEHSRKEQRQQSGDQGDRTRLLVTVSRYEGEKQRTEQREEDDERKHVSDHLNEPPQ